MKVALNFTASLGQAGALSGEVRRIGFAYLQHRVGRTAVITAFSGRVLYQAPPCRPRRRGRESCLPGAPGSGAVTCRLAASRRRPASLYAWTTKSVNRRRTAVAETVSSARRRQMSARRRPTSANGWQMSARRRPTSARRRPMSANRWPMSVKRGLTRSHVPPVLLRQPGRSAQLRPSPAHGSCFPRALPGSTAARLY